jgi:hypothetical protein
MRTVRRIGLSLLLLGVSALVAAQAGGDYTIAVDVSQTATTSTFTYTITKTTTDTPDLGHFIIDFGNCGDQSPTAANIVSATVNGVDWLGQIETTAGSSTCSVPSSNIVTFANLPPANSYIIVFTLNDVYPQMDAAAWLENGTTCVRKSVLGPGCKGYTRTTQMLATPALVGKSQADINNYMRNFGFDYTEEPNCTGGFGGHNDGIHGSVGLDWFSRQYAFRFDIHISPVFDGDRCSSTTVDRQRNEMKSRTENNVWAKVQGNWDEWQIVEWKFRLPAGFQPTNNFGHIHQLKAQDGPNAGAPVITLTPRSNSNGSNRRMQIIHSIDGAPTGKGTVVDNIPLSLFDNEWVQVREEVHFTHTGYYAMKVTRIRDGLVLIDYKIEPIDMWPGLASYVRTKWGIYRSLAGGRLDRDPVGQNPILKNEYIHINDFRIYEKNTNPTPGTPMP